MMAHPLLLILVQSRKRRMENACARAEKNVNGIEMLLKMAPTPFPLASWLVSRGRNDKQAQLRVFQ